MRHQVKPNLIHIVEVCTTLGKEDHDLQAKFASLARKVEALELKKSGQLKSVQDIGAKSVKLMNIQLRNVQLCLLLRNVSMNKPML